MFKLFNANLLKRNIVGNAIIMVPVFSLLLYRNHELNYAIRHGLGAGILFALIISVGILLLDPVIEVNVNEEEKVKSLRQKYFNLNSYQGDKMLVDKSGTLFGEVQLYFKLDSVTLKGSSYYVKKLLK